MANDKYVGLRILEAMHEAVNYAEAVFQVVQSVMPLPAGDVLDFGAGDGLFVRKFGQRGVLVDSLEPDLELKVELQSLGTKVFSRADEISDASYDFVYTINVLEHIENLDAACGELFRLIKPNGRLFVFVPAFESLWTKLDDEAGHVRRFTRNSLSSALTRSGFRIDRVEYFDSIGFPAALVVRILEKVGLFRYDRSTIGFYDRYVFPISRRLDRVCRRGFGKNVIASARKRP